MNKEEIIQMLKDNPIKIIKCGDIEIPVEYLKQTTVNVNGDDYIRLQQENKQLKDNWNKLKYFLKNTRKEHLEWDKKHNCEWKGYNAYSELLIKMQELEQGNNDNESI